MKITKKIARKVVYPAFFKMGLDKVMRSFTKNGILNVIYHGVVSKSDHFYYPRHIVADLFEKHLQYYTGNFDILGTEEAFHFYQNKLKPKRKSISISFDDGYLNNLTVALPLLEKYQVKAAFFVSGMCVEPPFQKVLWPDIIASLNHFNRDQIIRVGDYQFKNLREVSSNVDLREYLKTLSATDRDMILNKLYKEYKIEEKLQLLPKESWTLLAKEDVRKLAASKLTEIGSHGFSHYNLGLIDIQDAIHDMQNSRKVLEDAIQSEVVSIAYPDGSYNPDIKNEAEKAGYKYQLAVKYFYEEDHNDPRILNRYGISVTAPLESSMYFLNKAFFSMAYN